MANGESEVRTKRRRSEDSVHFGVFPGNGWLPLWDQEVVRLIRKELKCHPIQTEPKESELAKDPIPNKDKDERFQVPVVVLVELIAQAIATFEGFYLQKSDPSVAQRFNNPGNLRSWGKVPIGYPQGGEQGYANFPTAAEGWRALRIQVWKNVVGQGLSLVGLFQQYTPSDDGKRPMQCAEFVQGQLLQRGIYLNLNVAIKDMGTFVGSTGDYPGLLDV